MSSNVPERQPQSLATTAATSASVPSWLKVDTSPSSAPASSIESSSAPNAGARPSRRNSLDTVPALFPVVSATEAKSVVVETPSDKLFIAESSAAAQRRARQAAFVQTQVLSLLVSFVYRVTSPVCSG